MDDVKWATTQPDIEILVKNQSKLMNLLTKGFFLEVMLSDGRKITGYLSGSSSGNNAGEDSTWKYYGTAKMKLEDNSEVTFNLLDVVDVSNVTSKEILERFEKAGVIQVVTGPWEASQKEEFLESKGVERLKHMDKLSLIWAVMGFLLSIISLLFTLFSGGFYKKFFGAFLRCITDVAYASGGTGLADAQLQDGVKLFINAGISVAIIVGFFWSLGIVFHSKNEKSVKRANDVNKMLIGFLLGSAKNFLNL